MKRIQSQRRKLTRYWLEGSFFFMVFSCTQVALAAGQIRNNIMITVGVTVQATTCDLLSEEGSDTVTIDFESITKKGIEAGEYQSLVPIKITCSDDSPVLTLKLSGDGADFDATLLKSIDNAGLGFEFQLNNQKIALNTVSSSFKTSTIPTLRVLPRLTTNNVNIVAGDFTSATAKLILDYQ
ncbi:TPA: fimbrial protein [Providencia stuartii]|nr:fimbrial protein [Providencia stuartii]